ncbi:MAG: hypothetical protein QM532_02455, partial [Cyanobium sp. MAG06]|nr:hypothetical protein [Cyanobium sp. MAG06]
VIVHNIALNRTLLINYLHNSPDNIRYKSIENKTLEDYIMIVSVGRQEIYTSSFLYVFTKKLIPELQNKPDIIKSMLNKGVIQSKDILKLVNASTFFGEYNGKNGVSSLLIDNLSIGDQNILLDTVFDDINNNNNPEYAIVLHELLDQNKNNKVFSDLIINKIKNNYNKSKLSTKKIYLQLINVVLRDKIVEESIFPTIDKSILSKYANPDISRVDTNTLFNKDGVNVQRYYFYNDEDGVTSYQNFLSYYKNNKDYKITYHNNEKYIVVEKSVKGRTIRIYSNSPENNKDGKSDNIGINNLNNLFTSNSITTDYVVHRGHSYHVNNTIDTINKNTKMIFLGSCGGYNNMASALKKTDISTPIISTTAVGTKYVNDILLRIINEHILYKDTLK